MANKDGIAALIVKLAPRLVADRDLFEPVTVLKDQRFVRNPRLRLAQGGTVPLSIRTWPHVHNIALEGSGRLATRLQSLF